MVKVQETPQGRAFVNLTNVGRPFTGDKIVILESGRVMLGGLAHSWHAIDIDLLKEAVDIVHAESAMRRLAIAVAAA